MARRKKQSAGPDEAPGAPEWMVTFSDCMTLLLTFFVLLLSFSAFDEDILKQIRGSFNETFSYIGKKKAKNKEAFLATSQFVSGVKLEEGSEVPTLQQGRSDGVKEEVEQVDYVNRKVFVNPSSKMFWGRGSKISSGGRRTLLNVANLLKEIPGRVVISENGPEGDDNKHVGLIRTWKVFEYLTKKQGLDKNRFSISSQSTFSNKSSNQKQSQGIGRDERSLEIVILDRSVYN
ncbi:MAG: flagellar motor protein MotB [Planctomycetota bacterium]|jgi:chemotaxis protein MotB